MDPKKRIGLMRGQLRWFEYLLVVWFIVVYVFYFRQFTGLAREVFTVMVQSLKSLL